MTFCAFPSDFLLRTFTESGSKVEACEGDPIDLRMEEEQLTWSQKISQATRSVSNTWTAAVLATGMIALVVVSIIVVCKKKLNGLMLPI